jgi:hypothetical protein
MAQQSCGLNLKISQSFNVVAAKSQDRVEAHIGQYFLLTSYFQHLRRADPDGTFLFQVQEPQWLINCQQFWCCYVAFSFAKHAWDIGSIRVITSDGTVTKLGVFNHIVLLAVTHDGNNKLVLLAYAVCNVENEDNWTWFGELIAQNFKRLKHLWSTMRKGYKVVLFRQLCPGWALNLVSASGTLLVHKIQWSQCCKCSIYYPPDRKCDWCHKCLDHVFQGKLKVYNPTGNVWICNFGMFSLESDLFVKSLKIFEKGPPTQPSLILLTSNYCHPPYNCTTKVVFLGLTHWSVEIPSY